jgi:hypothetical protein
MIESEVFKKIEISVLKYCEHFCTPQNELRSIMAAVKNNDLGSLDDTQKILLWDALGRNEANIDRSDLEFLYERLGKIVFPQIYNKMANE